ncbi:MAG: DoxX family protein [Bacteroidetes bacterium]|nr:MAG: DoxX family protein [Bacteroidota bacterium]
MKILVQITRVLVGVLFIFSGLIKANDPLGLSYKMEEFFDAWNIHGLSSFTLAFSIIMIVFEILAGVAVLIGWRMRLFSWLLLLLIIFFTFLTGYAFFSGKIRECGCFGNCIPLTAGQSFFKDIILLLLICFLFIKSDQIKPVIPKLASQAILILTIVFSFSIQWFVLQYLPVVDCLPFQVNSNILERMMIPAGAIPDSTVISFIYDKNGKRVEFTADKFPSDFDDSYHFVKRYDKLIRKGNAEPLIKDFVLMTPSGNDTTLAVLKTPGYKVFIFAKDMPSSEPSWNREFSVIYSITKMKGIPVFFITANPEQVFVYLQRNNLLEEIPVLIADATVIRTAARANPTLFLLKNATILSKRSAADFRTAIRELSSLPSPGESPGVGN